MWFDDRLVCDYRIIQNVYSTFLVGKESFSIQVPSELKPGQMLTVKVPCACACTCTCTYTCMCTHMYMYICRIHLYMYIHVHIQCIMYTR